MNEHFQRIAGLANFGGVDKQTDSVIFDARLNTFAEFLVRDVISELMKLHHDMGGAHSHYLFAAKTLEKKYDL